MSEVSASVPRRVLLVEDEKRTRARLCKKLATGGRFDVVSAVGSLAEGAAALTELRPDVLVTDLGLPDGSGTDLLRAARADLPQCLCMVVTIFGDEKHVIDALEAGADGYILKDAPGDEFVRAVEELIAGGSPMSAPIARHLLQRFRQGAASTPPPVDEAAVELSAREFEILNLVAKGFRFSEIAEMLGVSPHTVRTYVRRVYDKLEVNSKGAAVYEAVNLGILKLD